MNKSSEHSTITITIPYDVVARVCAAQEAIDRLSSTVDVSSVARQGPAVDPRQLAMLYHHLRMTILYMAAFKQEPWTGAER